MAWNLEDISKDELRASSKQDFNARQKSIARMIGENMASIGCVIVVILFVGYIWTDMKIDVFSERMLCDAAVSLVSFILVEDLMSRNGINCGKLYDEYIRTYNAYVKLRERVISAGVTLLEKFCDDTVDAEYDAYLTRKCKSLHLTRAEYEEMSRLTKKELKRYPKWKRVAVGVLNQVKPIELTSDLLLTDGTGEKNERRGISIGAQEYVKRSTRGWFNLTLTAVTCAFSASIAFFANAGASWGLVMYTLLKLALLCWRMYKGFSAGSRAYNTFEVKHLQDKMTYMHLYLEYLSKAEKETHTETACLE